MRSRCLVLLLAISAAACAADREFDRVVHEIESHYGTKRTHIPLMGVANFVVKVGRPAGASGFKLAVFQDLDSSREYGDEADLERFMDRLGSRSLSPIIRARSHSKGEYTYIFLGEVGKSTRVLVATFQRREATVVEVKVKMDTLMQMLGSPGGAGKSISGNAWLRDR
jgi:hypothetical protein